MFSKDDPADGAAKGPEGRRIWKQGPTGRAAPSPQRGTMVAGPGVAAARRQRYGHKGEIHSIELAGLGGGRSGWGEPGRRWETTETCALKLLRNKLSVFILPNLIVSSLLDEVLG